MLYDYANKPKVFIRIAGANHIDIPEKIGEYQYLLTVSDFILNPPH